jgi:hypothetical protein
MAWRIYKQHMQWTIDIDLHQAPLNEFKKETQEEQDDVKRFLQQVHMLEFTHNNLVHNEGTTGWMMGKDLYPIFEKFCGGKEAVRIKDQCGSSISLGKKLSAFASYEYVDGQEKPLTGPEATLSYLGVKPAKKYNGKAKTANSYMITYNKDVLQEQEENHNMNMLSPGRAPVHVSAESLSGGKEEEKQPAVFTDEEFAEAQQALEDLVLQDKDDDNTSELSSSSP